MKLRLNRHEKTVAYLSLLFGLALGVISVLYYVIDGSLMFMLLLIVFGMILFEFVTYVVLLLMGVSLRLRS